MRDSCTRVRGFSIVQAPLQSELLHVYKSTSKDQKSPFWSSSIAILSPLFPWLLLSTSHLLPFIRLISRLISPLYFIYLLSILVEVLLRLLTYRVDLVLLYLVSEDRS
jgi:antibiotic biosynthesis monooxygenase (ABM) superfamily enzyme